MKKWYYFNLVKFDKHETVLISASPTICEPTAPLKILPKLNENCAMIVLTRKKDIPSRPRFSKTGCPMGKRIIPGASEEARSDFGRV